MYNLKRKIESHEDYFNKRKADCDAITELYKDNDNINLERVEGFCTKYKDGPDIVIGQKDDQPAYDELIGDHETQVSEGAESDLHKHRKGCTKNPGHKEFISIGRFSLQHLPERFCDNDLYLYIKAVADLTVRIDVRMTSPSRPAVWPKTNIPYPFYNMIKLTKLRLGTGRIHKIDQFTDGVNTNSSVPWKEYKTCWCKNCQSSASPSSVWWEFHVATATHVVFDDVEASHASLRVFYDSDDCPVVNIDMVCLDYVNIEHDLCGLRCVTCDKGLGTKLDTMWRGYFDVWYNVFIKYRSTRDFDKLNLIVSHPHGCAKQVSIGRWKDKYKVNGYNKFTYNTSTCPGSSGAYVYCVGYDTRAYSTELVHSGSLKPGLNISGVGYSG